jgi:hypothetical protein
LYPYWSCTAPVLATVKFAVLQAIFGGFSYLFPLVAVTHTARL